LKSERISSDQENRKSNSKFKHDNNKENFIEVNLIRKENKVKNQKEIIDRIYKEKEELQIKYEKELEKENFYIKKNDKDIKENLLVYKSF
jgi:hypothetical protein